MNEENPEEDITPDILDAVADVAIERKKPVDLEEVFSEPPAPVEYNKGQIAVERAKEKAGLGVKDSDYYQKEYLLRLTHRLLLRGATVNDISKTLQVSIKQASELRKELYSRLGNELRETDKFQLAGKTIAFYDSVIAEQMLIVDKVDKDDKVRNKYLTKIQALDGAIRAMSEKQKFLGLVGFWDTPIEPNKDKGNKYSEDANQVRDLISGVIQGDTAVLDLENIEKTDDDDDIRLT